MRTGKPVPCQHGGMFHGEYKTPGGKLVIVDFRVEDGMIADASINGDFFMEPAESLEALNAALNGASADSDEATLTELLSAAVPAGTHMIGFAPDGIAIAVRRALS